MLIYLSSISTDISLSLLHYSLHPSLSPTPSPFPFFIFTSLVYLPLGNVLHPPGAWWSRQLVVCGQRWLPDDEVGGGEVVGFSWWWSYCICWTKRWMWFLDSNLVGFVVRWWMANKRVWGELVIKSVVVGLLVWLWLGEGDLVVVSVRLQYN